MSREITYRFCPECGARMLGGIQAPGGAPLPSCPQCGLVIHPDPKTAAASLLIQDDAVLLLRRARPPQKGFWCLPGGFVDRGEVMEAAAAREVVEETGLVVRVDRLNGLYSYPGYPIVAAIFEATITGGEFALSPESLEAHWFKPGEVPWDELAFPSTRDVLAAWAGA